MRTLVLFPLVAAFLAGGAAAAQIAAGPGASLLERSSDHDAFVAEPRAIEPVAPASIAPAEATPEPVRGNPLWGIPLDKLSATRERPLFSESRRPPPVAAAEPVQEISAPVDVPPPAPEAPPLTLVGTVVGAAEENFAVFLNSSARAVVRLRVGEADSGWTLRSVESKSTTLEKDSQEVTLSLPAPNLAPNPEADPAQFFENIEQPPFPGNAPPGPRGGPNPARPATPLPFPDEMPQGQEY